MIKIETKKIKNLKSKSTNKLIIINIYMNECIYKLTFHFFVRKCKKSIFKINLKQSKYKFIPFTSYN